MIGLENPFHILLLLVVVLLVFGAKRLPEMGRSLGSGLRGFKDSLSGAPEPVRTPELAASSTPSAQEPAADRSTH
jgi:sec-independent protein translocase protein TatA